MFARTFLLIALALVAMLAAGCEANVEIEKEVQIGEPVPTPEISMEDRMSEAMVCEADRNELSELDDTWVFHVEHLAITLDEAKIRRSIQLTPLSVTRTVLTFGAECYLTIA